MRTSPDGAKERHEVDDLDRPRRLPRVEQVAARPEDVAAQGDQERDLRGGGYLFILFTEEEGEAEEGCILK